MNHLIDIANYNKQNGDIYFAIEVYNFILEYDQNN